MITITRKTGRPEGDADFEYLAARIDASLSNAGYRCRRREGSISWGGTTTASEPPQVLFKFCFYHPGDMTFGVRKDFAAGHDKLRSVKWAVEFGVPPRTDIEFCGLPVTNDEASITRLERILIALGIPRGLGDADPGYEKRLAALDESLDQMGL
jgi:hypothetical protein